MFLAELKEGKASSEVLKFDVSGYYDALELLDKKNAERYKSCSD